ncbi:MAG: hypothetical protein ACFB50_05825 [Rubrobacteraceae bacterium]
MIARISTELDAPAREVWALLKRKQTFLYVTRGVMGVPAAKAWPEEHREGLKVRGRIWFFHAIPGWRHEIRVVSVDKERREIRTRERGGFVEVWNHLLKVEALSEESSLYTDEVEIEAGMLTPVVWAVAHLFYRYRQARWRSLAKVIFSRG